MACVRASGAGRVGQTRLDLQGFLLRKSAVREGSGRSRGSAYGSATVTCWRVRPGRNQSAKSIKSERAREKQRSS